MPSHLHCTPCCCVPCGNLMSLAGRVKNSFLCSCLCGWLAIRRCSKCWHCETASVICWAAQRGLTNEFIWNWLIMSTLYLGEEVLWRCRSWFVTRFMGCGLPHACHFLAFTEMLRCRSASNTPTICYRWTKMWSWQVPTAAQGFKTLCFASFGITVLTAWVCNRSSRVYNVICLPHHICDILPKLPQQLCT